VASSDGGVDLLTVIEVQIGVPSVGVPGGDPLDGWTDVRGRRVRGRSGIEPSRVSSLERSRRGRTGVPLNHPGSREDNRGPPGHSGSISSRWRSLAQDGSGDN